MKAQALRSTVRGLALLAMTGALTTTAVGDDNHSPPSPVHYSGLLNDYTPSAAVVKGGPYEMRGKWTLELHPWDGTARFSAAFNMETSDYGIVQGSVNKDDPTTRAAHTHHISMTDGVVTNDWTTSCPSFVGSPAVTGGFVVTGTAYVAANGVPAPFGNPSPLTICILGGTKVEFSNITLTFGAPANTHFGTQAIHGVVVKCTEPWKQGSPDCTVQE